MTGAKIVVVHMQRIQPVQKRAEFHKPVALDAGIRRSAGTVFIPEIRKHHMAELRAHVNDAIFDAVFGAKIAAFFDIYLLGRAVTRCAHRLPAL